MSKQTIWTALAPMAAAALLLLPGSAQALSQHYAIEFNCGTVDPSGSPAFGAVPGDYATSISVLNGQTRAVALEASVVLTVPGGFTSDTIRTRIQPGAARTIDCADILGRIFTFPSQLPTPTPDYFKGFVTMKTQNELAVSAHYSATGQGDISSQVSQVEGARTFFWIRRDKKVEICHVPPGNPERQHEIEIDDSSIPAHLRHGDYRGSCD
jgi:hypothetical protein